jgi:hypothetical protein
MNPVRLMLCASFIALGCLAPKAFADRDSNSQPQILERGPIHEAFAMPWQANASPNSPISQQPPESIKEEPPEQAPAGKNVKWIPGYWQWDAEKHDFVWVGGLWRDVPDGRRWVPGYWAQTSAGNRWVSGHWAADQEPDSQYVPQPPDNPDAGPSTPPPDDQSFYIPGTWFYGDSGYGYRPGYWAGYRPGYLWYPARYIWTPLGFLFASGYWDYYWPARGLLYPALYYGNHFPFIGYIYHPYYALRVNPLAAALYVNPHVSHYYYGNYAGANFRQWGLQSWANYSARSYDPVFAYERVANRGNPQWQAGLQTLPAGGVNSASLLNSTQQLRNSGAQFSQLSPQQRQAQLQGAQQLTSQSQLFSQQASRNFAAGTTNAGRGLSTSNYPSGTNLNSHASFNAGTNSIPRTNVPNVSGNSWSNHPSFSYGNSGFGRPSYGTSSGSHSSSSSHSSSKHR